jgi:hypothetical protein
MDPHPWLTVRYEDLEPRLRTGDVLLFHGASRRSRIIEAASGSEFSHVGMIVRPKDGLPPLLWHADPRAVTDDVLGNREHAGAQLNDLSAALAVMTSSEYGDTPFVRQLTAERTPEMDEAALQAVVAVDQTSFPSLLNFMKQWVLGHLHITTSGKRMECAEVLARTYQRMGLLPPEPPPNGYAPRDFSAQHSKLHLLRGGALGPQVEVLWSGPGSGAARRPY